MPFSITGNGGFFRIPVNSTPGGYLRITKTNVPTGPEEFSSTWQKAFYPNRFDSILTFGTFKRPNQNSDYQIQHWGVTGNSPTLSASINFSTPSIDPFYATADLTKPTSLDPDAGYAILGTFKGGASPKIAGLLVYDVDLATVVSSTLLDLGINSQFDVTPSVLEIDYVSPFAHAWAAGYFSSSEYGVTSIVWRVDGQTGVVSTFFPRPSTPIYDATQVYVRDIKIGNDGTAWVIGDVSYESQNSYLWRISDNVIDGGVLLTSENPLGYAALVDAGLYMIEPLDYVGKFDGEVYTQIAVDDPMSNTVTLNAATLNDSNNTYEVLGALHGTGNDRTAFLYTVDLFSDTVTSTSLPPGSAITANRTIANKVAAGSDGTVYASGYYSDSAETTLFPVMWKVNGGSATVIDFGTNAELSSSTIYDFAINSSSNQIGVTLEKTVNSVDRMIVATVNTASSIESIAEITYYGTVYPSTGNYTAKPGWDENVFSLAFGNGSYSASSSNYPLIFPEDSFNNVLVNLIYYATSSDFAVNKAGFSMSVNFINDETLFTMPASSSLIPVILGQEISGTITSSSQLTASYGTPKNPPYNNEENFTFSSTDFSGVYGPYSVGVAVFDTVTPASSSFVVVSLPSTFTYISGVLTASFGGGGGG